jgi:hypothetical protein
MNADTRHKTSMVLWWRMVSSGMLRRVALGRADVSEERSASFTLRFLRSVHRLLVAASVVPSSPILVTLMKEALCSSETSVLTRATRRNNPDDTIFHSHRRENLKSYMVLWCSTDGIRFKLLNKLMPVHSEEELGADLRLQISWKGVLVQPRREPWDPNRLFSII